jgi:hypothetical protein
MQLANRFTINPVAAILSLIFWYWMWRLRGDLGGAPVGNHQDHLRSSATASRVWSPAGRISLKGWLKPPVDPRAPSRAAARSSRGNQVLDFIGRRVPVGSGDLNGYLGSALQNSKHCAPKKSQSPKGASASLICWITWGNIDLVHSVPIALGFAENCAVLSFQVDPRYRKRIVLRVAAKAKNDRIADPDPGWQADMLIRLAGGGDKPAAAFGHQRRPVRPLRRRQPRLCRNHKR